MTKLVYSIAARGDLEEIGDYIMSQLHNSTAALRVIRQIYKDVDSLRTFPEMGAPLHREDGGIPYRYLVSGNYLVFYHVEKEQVRVDRVLYGRRDYAALLFDGDLLPEN